MSRQPSSAMKLPTLVMFLMSAASAAAAESPPSGEATTLPRYAFKPLVDDYYPSASRSQKEQGTTKLELCYDDQGRSTQVKVGESSGFAKLDQAALRWGKSVRIAPGLLGGRPRPGCVSIPVKFSLEKSREPDDQGEPMLINPPPMIDIPSPPPRYPGRFIPLGSGIR